ncbi:MAG: hypothetical protein QM655_01970 [Nocardioidaceae bacterium]
MAPGDSDLLSEFCLVGTPESVAAQIRAHAQLGVTDVNLRLAPLGLPSEAVDRTLLMLPGVHDLVAAEP